MGGLHCLSHQLTVGWLDGTEMLVAALSVKALVAWLIGDLRLVAKDGLQTFEWCDLTTGLHACSHTAKRHLHHGILADDSDVADMLRINGQQLFVLQQHDAATCHL